MKGNCPIAGLPGGRVIVCGNAGVGKSYLIGVLMGDRNITKSGVGEQTTEIRICDRRRDGIPLVFYDTPGFEIARLEDTWRMVRIEMARKSVSPNPDHHYYVGLLCITESEGRCLESDQQMFDLFTFLKIPVIVVLTKAEPPGDPDGEAMEKLVKNKLRGVTVVHVNAKRMEGIEELVGHLAVYVQEGREVAQRTAYEAQSFEDRATFLADNVILVAFSIAKEKGRPFLLGLPIVDTLSVHSGEEEVVRTCSRLYNFVPTEPFIKRITESWRGSPLAKKEYRRLRVGWISKTASLVLSAVTDGLADLAILGFGFLGDKIGLPVAEVGKFLRLDAISRIIAIWGIVYVRMLDLLHREAYGSLEPMNWETELLNMLPNMLEVVAACDCFEYHAD